MRAILDMVQANKELTDLAGSVGLTLRDLMYDQGRLLAQDAVRRVKPGGPQQKTAAQKKAGLRAIDNDIRSMFWGVDTQAALNRWDKSMSKSNAGLELYVGTKQGGKVLRADKLLYRADNQTLSGLHKKHRNPKGRAKFRTDGKDLAGGKFVTTKGILNKFIRSQKNKMGQLKAGFLPAVDYFAGLVGTTPKAIPVWVRKQAKKMGSQINGVNRTTGVGFVEIVNSVPYAELGIPQSLIARLEDTRRKDIMGNAKKRINKVAKDHNAKYARAA